MNIFLRHILDRLIRTGDLTVTDADGAAHRFGDGAGEPIHILLHTHHAERAIAIDPNDAGIQYNVACLFALEGEKTRAILSLEAAVRAGFAHRDWVAKDPDLDSLRDDPRFQALKWRD